MAETQSEPVRPYDPSVFEGPAIRQKREIPDGLWMRCPGCEGTLYRKVVADNLEVCPECQYHFRLGGRKRIRHLADEGSFEELFTEVAPADPLDFKWLGQSYAERVRKEQQKTGETETEMTVMSAVVPSLASTAGAVPDDCKPFIAASQGVQSDHPEFVRRAAEIVGRKEQPLDKARAIFEWVHRKVDKRATVSLPSALDVLHTMRGDCNEHTYLFVALARAAGLPAKIMVGLAHHEGAFYYHAWPAVYVGEWLEMDPTWGQEGVDATHIALVQGGLTDQMRLVKVVGQLKIKILEEYPRD